MASSKTPRGRGVGAARRDWPAMPYVLMVLAVVLSACAPRSIEVKGVGRPIVADDGATLMAFRFADPRFSKAPARGLVLYCQGSEPRSVTEHAGALAGFCAMNAPVIGVERRGVRPDGPPDLDAFRAGSTLERRVGDHLAALAWGLEGQPAGLPVVLLGASEGGDVAAAIAARTPRVTHVILLGAGGGWTQEEEFRHFLRTTGRCLDLADEATLDARVADIKAHPDADTLWAGHPYRRWSSFMFRRPGDDLLKVDRPILLVHGDRDSSVPVESARALKGMFDGAGKTNLTLVEIPGADHTFADPGTGVSRRPMVELAIVGWLAREGVLTRAEASAYESRVRRAHPELFGR